MNINGYCPHCKADLDGDLVVETFIKQGMSREKAEESASHYYGWKQHGLQNRWGRKIGLSSITHDRIMEWQCPDCSGRWSRF